MSCRWTIDELVLATGGAPIRKSWSRDDWRIAEAPTSRLLLACPDRPGLIAAVSGFLADAGLNIVDADQHSSNEGRFFMRMVFDAVPEASGRAAARFEAEVAGALRDGLPLRRVERAQAGRDHGLARRPLPLRPALALAQRRARRRRRRRRLQPPRPRRAGRDRSAFPSTTCRSSPAQGGGGGAGRWSCSARSTCSSSPATCRSSPPSFLRRLDAPAINIHHSFLPAFVGADPYRRAHERGVKLIGATAHYVTEELDAGPIIDQDVTRVSHRDEVDDLKRIGRDIERLVLARAVKAHLDDRVLLDGARTIVF